MQHNCHEYESRRFSKVLSGTHPSLQRRSQLMQRVTCGRVLTVDQVQRRHLRGLVLPGLTFRLSETFLVCTAPAQGKTQDHAELTCSFYQRVDPLNAHRRGGGNAIYHEFIMTIEPRGMRYPLYSSSAMLGCGTPRGEVTPQGSILQLHELSSVVTTCGMSS